MSKTSRSIPLVAAALERSSDLAIVLGVSWLARVIFVFAIDWSWPSPLSSSRCT
jgi:hypothetical protein